MRVRFLTLAAIIALAPALVAAQEGDPPPAGAQTGDSVAVQTGDSTSSASSAAPAGAGAGSEQAPPRVGDPRLVFEREVFSYPAFDRRNPFLSLVAEGAGPRFEQMRLEMIIHSEDPQRSVALLSAGRRGAPSGQEEAGSPRGQSQRVRVGERWGNVRVLAIRKTQVVVEVEEFGLTEQRTMDLPTRGQGGSR